MANEEKKDVGNPPPTTVKPDHAKPVQQAPPVDPKKAATIRRVMEGDENKRGKK